MKKIFTLIAALTLSVGLWAINNVPYIDANGQEQHIDGVTGVINSTDTLKAGWYVVMPTGSEKRTGTLVCKGEVHLIVYDNAKLTATGADGKPGIEVSGEGNSLTIYGYTNQSGQLIAIGGANAAGIGGGNAAAGSNITICGGKITANGGENASAIGSGKGGDAASNIFVTTSFVVKADGNNPPTTVIAATRTATTDIAANLAGQRYATIEKGTNAQEPKITTVAGITSGNKYYIGATTGGNDFYFYVDGSSTTQSIKGAAKEDKAEAVALTFTEVTDGWTIQFDNGLYLGLKNAKDNGAVQVMEAPVVWTIEEDADKGLLTLRSNDHYLQKQKSGTQFGSYNKNAQTDVWLEFAGSAPVSLILESVYIKGDATKMEYKVGESFDPAGLEVWGVYTKTVKNDTQSQITSGITWTIDPETFTEASDNASVKLSASYKNKTSEDKTITGIKVNAVPAPAPTVDETGITVNGRKYGFPVRLVTEVK